MASRPSSPAAPTQGVRSMMRSSDASVELIVTTKTRFESSSTTARRVPPLVEPPSIHETASASATPKVPRSQLSTRDHPEPEVCHAMTSFSLLSTAHRRPSPEIVAPERSLKPGAPGNVESPVSGSHEGWAEALLPAKVTVARRAPMVRTRALVQVARCVNRNMSKPSAQGHVSQLHQRMSSAERSIRPSDARSEMARGTYPSFAVATENRVSACRFRRDASFR